jgi:capsule polysaccharide export protein KpsE/RkpR
MEHPMTETTSPAKVTINDTEYLLDDLSDNAKAQLQSMVFAQNEIKRLRSQLAVAETALRAYQQVLVSELPQQTS